MPQLDTSAFKLADNSNNEPQLDLSKFQLDTSKFDSGSQEKLQEPSIGSKIYDFLMKPLLPDIPNPDTQTDTYIGSNTPIIKDIWPGGIRVPHLNEITNEMNHMLTAPIGLATMGLEGAINRFEPRAGSPVEEPLSKLTDIVPEKPVQPQQLALPPARSTQLPEADVFKSFTEGPNLGTGKPAELLQQNSLKPVGEVDNQYPDIPKPSLDQIHSQPIVQPTTLADITVPKPGQATVNLSQKDISPLTANFTSADQTLTSREVTKPIADTIIKAQDQKTQWVATTQRELADLSNGLNKQDRITLGKLLDGQDISDANPDLQDRANKARIILNSVHDMFPEGAKKSGENVGYLENYFTHVQNQPDSIRSAIGQIIDNHFGILFRSPGMLSNEPSGTTGNLRETGMGKPSSPYVEERTGKATDLQYDVNKVFPAYIESAAKVIFDKPAVEAATKMLKSVPDSNLKELATAYIKNYSNYDSSPLLHNAWNTWANTIARTTARSLLGFNTGLQTLHVARIAGNLYPELGEKYTGYGIGELAKHPIQSWQETAKLGLLQNAIRPFNFQTPMQRFDSISNFLDLGNYLDKAIGYQGFKKKFTDSGMPEDQASLAAIREVKRVSHVVDPARQMKGMGSSSDSFGGAAAKLGWQFKPVPAKIVEQYTRIAMDLKNNPKRVARMIGGVGMVMAANEGLKTFHLNPSALVPWSTLGAAGDVATRVISKLSKGDVAGALSETALWATPGGKSIQRQINSGLSAFQPDDQK